VAGRGRSGPGRLRRCPGRWVGDPIARGRHGMFRHSAMSRRHGLLQRGVQKLVPARFALLMPDRRPSSRTLCRPPSAGPVLRFGRVTGHDDSSVSPRVDLASASAWTQSDHLGTPSAGSTLVARQHVAADGAGHGAQVLAVQRLRPVISFRCGAPAGPVATEVTRRSRPPACGRRDRVVKNQVTPAAGQQLLPISPSCLQTMFAPHASALATYVASPRRTA